ncbi:MAG TPA: tetratricopeptide repeat protein [Gammaproteobacteria bacterium]|nr:tetratricopeptide repeat protein [Gammaproteobacteria bacterium]
MSLVNQMLRDLETRREREEAAPPPRAEVRAVRIASGRGRWPLLAGGVAIVAAGAVYAAVVIGGDRVAEPAMAQPVKTEVKTAAISRNKPAAPIESRPIPIPSRPTALSSPSPLRREARGEGSAVDKPRSNSTAPDSGHPHPNPFPEGRGAKKAAPAAAQKANPTVRHAAQRAAPVMTKTPRPVTPAQRAAAAYAAGVSAAQAGDVARAETEFRAALAADPTAYGAREALAALLNQQGRMKQAMQLFVTGMRVDPMHRERFARAYARLLVAHNQVAQAMTILKDTLPPAAQAPEHYAFLAALQERRGQHQAAVTNYAKALAVRPAQGRWWAGLAVAYDQLRERDKALAAYQRARDAGGLGVTLATYVNQRISALRP